MAQIDYSQLIVSSLGRGYKNSQIVAWSYYKTPIDSSAGRLAGNSRRWGDASAEVQMAVIDTIINKCREYGLNDRDTAYVLAIARVESGFNPDAAAGTTSASGLGQFINRTGAYYGLTNTNRWDLDTQATALVVHYIDNWNLANNRGKGED